METKNPKRVHDGFVKVEKHADGIEVVRSSDSVVVLLHDVVNGVVLLVSQERRPMVSDRNPTGRITECVAGRFDKKLGIKALAIAEAKEEFGVDLHEGDIQILNGGEPLALSPGILTERSYLLYAEVRPEQIEDGEHVRGVGKHEAITRVRVPVHSLEHMTFDSMSCFALVQWFLREIKH